MDKRVKVWYDPVGDLLEVRWGTAPGYYTATAHEQVEAHVDLAGDIQGFFVFGVSKMDSAATVDLIPAKAAQAASSSQDFRAAGDAS